MFVRPWIVVLLALCAFCLLAGASVPQSAHASATGALGGPTPDKPPQPPPPPAPPPPPPPAQVAPPPPPPPPPAYVPPPPPPAAAVQHRRVHRHTHKVVVVRNVAPKQKQTQKPKPAPKARVAVARVKPVTLASAPVATSSGPATARALTLIGLAFGIFAICLSLLPVYALPPQLRPVFFRSRQTIMLTGLAISFGCAIGLISTVAGQ